ncbi:SHOCT domain-containing protein [Microbacterium sp. NPDC019599]|uniref:SHOCT domain-containing protein n=1 Tax=Microbacterium sp. NPDC019599 TaxID=3154690 RepID=UPI0033E6C35A
MDMLFAGAGGFMVLAFVMFGAFFIAVLTFIVVAIVRNARKAREAGYDPMTMQTELTARAMSSELLQPAKSTEQRLRELDDLRARGVISAEERDRARADILRG